MRTTPLRRSPTLRGSPRRTLHPGHPFLVTTRPRSSLLTKYKDSQPIPTIRRLAVRQQHYGLQSLPCCVGLSVFGLGPTRLHDHHSSLQLLGLYMIEPAFASRLQSMTSGQLRDRSQPRLRCKSPTFIMRLCSTPRSDYRLSAIGRSALPTRPTRLHTYTSYSVTSRESTHRLLGLNRSVSEYSLMR